MAKKAYATRAKNSSTHPGTPDMPAARRSSAQVAAERRIKALEEEEAKANELSLKAKIALLEARTVELEAMITAPSAPAPNVTTKARGGRQPQAKPTAPATTASSSAAPKTPVSPSLNHTISD